MIDERRFTSRQGTEITIGMVVRNDKGDTGICVGRHMDENIVFIRFGEGEHVYQIHPSRLDDVLGEWRQNRTAEKDG